MAKKNKRKKLINKLNNIEERFTKFQQDLVFIKNQNRENSNYQRDGTLAVLKELDEIQRKNYIMDKAISESGIEYKADMVDKLESMTNPNNEPLNEVSNGKIEINEAKKVRLKRLLLWLKTLFKHKKKVGFLILLSTMLEFIDFGPWSLIVKGVLMLFGG